MSKGPNSPEWRDIRESEDVVALAMDIAEWSEALLKLVRQHASAEWTEAALEKATVIRSSARKMKALALKGHPHKR